MAMLSFFLFLCLNVENDAKVTTSFIILFTVQIRYIILLKYNKKVDGVK